MFGNLRQFSKVNANLRFRWTRHNNKNNAALINLPQIRQISDSSSQDKSAPSNVTRWLMLAPAFTAHVCIGAPYGWSAVSGPMGRQLGVVAAAADDWPLHLCSYPMSITLAGAGVGAALSGKWAMRVGLKKAMLAGGFAYCLGFGVAAAGIASHCLPLVYAGNILSGLGYGVAYMPPIQALLEWFPDRRGLASGAVISGFGCGALVFSPAVSHLATAFATVPTYLGAAVDTVTRDGRFFTAADGLELVRASAAELSNLPYGGLQEGFYLVGSGDTGVAATLAAMGVGYMAVIACCTAAIRRPPPGYLPSGFKQPETNIGNNNVHVDMVMKTPQFYLMFGTAVLLGTGGMGLIAVAKPMVSEIFSAALPTVVTPVFASSYLLALAGGNLFGRLLWAAASDKIGRRNMFHIFAFGNAAIFAAMPTLIEGAVATSTSSILYLGAFCASSVATLSVMGGTYACMPAYEADLWGAKYVQAIHGYFLAAPAVATVVGPAVLLNLRSRAEDRAMTDMLTLVDPIKFREVFGAGIESAGDLAEAKTLTLAKLYQLLPPGTAADPLPLLYHDTLYAMAALAGAAACLHFAVGPVDRKYFERAESESGAKSNDENNNKIK